MGRCFLKASLSFFAIFIPTSIYQPPMDFLEPAQQPIRQAIQNEESTQRAQQFAEVLEVIIDRNEKRIFLYNIYQDTREELLNYYIGAPKQNIYLPTGEYSIDKISWNPHWHPTTMQTA